MFNEKHFSIFIHNFIPFSKYLILKFNYWNCFKIRKYFFWNRLFRVTSIEMLPSSIIYSRQNIVELFHCSVMLVHLLTLTFFILISKLVRHKWLNFIWSVCCLQLIILSFFIVYNGRELEAKESEVICGIINMWIKYFKRDHSITAACHHCTRKLF